MILANSNLNEFLANNAVWIALGFVLLIVVVLLVILAIFLVKKRNKKIINPNNNEEFFNALGGKENIVSIDLVGSRLKLKINSNEKIDQEKLKELGVDNTIVMSNQVTLVLNDKIKDEFKNFKLN